MLLHIGDNRAVCLTNIVGMFKFTLLDSSKYWREWYKTQMKNRMVYKFSQRKFKSFLITWYGEVILCPVLPKYLVNRWDTMCKESIYNPANRKPIPGVKEPYVPNGYELPGYEFDTKQLMNKIDVYETFCKKEAIKKAWRRHNKYKPKGKPPHFAKL